MLRVWSRVSTPLLPLSVLESNLIPSALISGVLWLVLRYLPLDKLNSYGLCTGYINSFCSYATNGPIFVEFSSLFIALSGSPQGSILVSLFSVHILTICLSKLNIRIFFYLLCPDERYPKKNIYRKLIVIHVSSLCHRKRKHWKFFFHARLTRMSQLVTFGQLSNNGNDIDTRGTGSMRAVASRLAISYGCPKSF
jgi:hypothetical protein